MKLRNREKSNGKKREFYTVHCFMAIRCNNKTLHTLFLKTMKNHVPFALNVFFLLFFLILSLSLFSLPHHSFANTLTHKFERFSHSIAQLEQWCDVTDFTASTFSDRIYFEFYLNGNVKLSPVACGPLIEFNYQPII